ncbi:hypothetical protein F441_14823 [Phytophthora nicotianae CJ01A1]|uniref:Uncharacterized protein n=1 Tax=Phytophthora nicotianae CJ01A1 TaxID=1317063 RepID=W2WFP8_PHYNI|nr:hypothetical protein F441_14823 [Phytophthora nicotianae CJ01A1]
MMNGDKDAMGKDGMLVEAFSDADYANCVALSTMVSVQCG